MFGFPPSFLPKPFRFHICTALKRNRSRTWVCIQTGLNDSSHCRFVGKPGKTTETPGKPEFGVTVKHETRLLSCGLGFFCCKTLGAAARGESATAERTAACPWQRGIQIQPGSSPWQMINQDWEPPHYSGRWSSATSTGRALGTARDPRRGGCPAPARLRWIRACGRAWTCHGTWNCASGRCWQLPVGSRDPSMALLRAISSYSSSFPCPADGKEGVGILHSPRCLTPSRQCGGGIGLLWDFFKFEEFLGCLESELLL